MTATPMTSAETTHRNLLSLHRYWIYADKMKRLFFKELMSTDLKKISHAEIFLTDYCAYMFYWYGALYIVIEGYQELSIADAEIDRLLSDNRIYLFSAAPKWYLPLSNRLLLYQTSRFYYQPRLGDLGTIVARTTWGGPTSATYGSQSGLGRRAADREVKPRAVMRRNGRRILSLGNSWRPFDQPVDAGARRQPRHAGAATASA